MGFIYIQNEKWQALENLLEKEALNSSQLVYWFANRLKANNRAEIAISILKIDESINGDFELNSKLLADLQSNKSK